MCVCACVCIYIYLYTRIHIIYISIKHYTYMVYIYIVCAFSSVSAAVVGWFLFRFRSFKRRVLPPPSPPSSMFVIAFVLACFHRVNLNVTYKIYLFIYFITFIFSEKERLLWS